ncbi:GTP cyclohydrolase I FolE [Helicobacter winghamensis]|uniref:GTP cyclohydrolase 1 n=1 Tax=Helicobacter winghamensis TaxID=157268 RepID=A0A2N3PL32_9HELI|nr:GTP cyclohydrolase I FolE [Helicobacter winghamensis]EEO26630.1 GTP cyclohydrolase I [Helicobacter winghamensis ATCC BAA-430]PKT79234.1 GTP cyclohydrolase I FolE [Helicobacter winghamensis]PKT79320.1 GTP cyclohydrolase I FolE [Helicobacter winghamensis]PKT79438.1 GTP cyclohydrolase I FolE [Helicobacter winghamensis]PKT82411.1 GTP cyclohydrolase I FolE [Helicobacter winghamensis]
MPKNIKENTGESTQELIRTIFDCIGEDRNREGLLDTPKRVVKSWEHLYSGYKSDPKEILGRVFTEGACDEMVVLKDIEFYSVCEHHMLPFFGKVSIGYIPDSKVVGISKLARLVEVYSRRLQIQEKMTAQIADTLMEVLQPKGVMVVAEAKHMCMVMRGVEKQNSQMLTSAIRGLFKSDHRTREEFMGLIRS